MKHSQLIGIIAVLALAAVAFMQWVYIPSVNITVTGLHAEGTNYGKPALLGLVFGCANVILFLTPKIWAKRTNVFMAAITLAWAIRNFIIISACHEGDCPQKKAGLYLQVLFSFIVLLMSLFPKIELPPQENPKQEAPGPTAVASKAPGQEEVSNSNNTIAEGPQAG